MGRYISMGSAFIYSIPKNRLSESLHRNNINGKSDSETSDELSKNFPMNIYKLSVNENWYHFLLRDDVSVDDFIKLYDSFFSTIPHRPYETAEIETNRSAVAQMKNMDEVFEYVDNSRYHFSSIDLPFYFHSKKYKLFGDEIWVPTSIAGPTFYVDQDKTDSEDGLATFEIFTELLQYRFKELKLGKTLLVFLSA